MRVFRKCWGCKKNNGTDRPKEGRRDILTRKSKEPSYIKKDAERWDDMHQNGCRNLSWSDKRVNLKLIRNYILYYKKERKANERKRLETA